MILNTTIVFVGSSDLLYTIQQECHAIETKDIQGPNLFKAGKLYKRMKGLHVVEINRHAETPYLIISFKSKSTDTQAILDRFKQFSTPMFTMSENEKETVWILSDIQTFERFRLIPEWAIEGILKSYMEYTESSIMLDNFQSIQLDRNTQRLVLNQNKLEPGELTSIFFEETLKGRYVVELLEGFTTSFHQTCINHYGDLYSSNKENWEGEGTTPLALFIVTFGILAIIVAFLFFMGYL
jgi:hypothetical protein